jgi:aryl-alcohol dehydrogenase-like predicted oxidoreductase
MGFGAMRLTGSAAFDAGQPSERERSRAVLRRAIDLGVNHIDTAAFYFSSIRSANELINSALAPYPDELTIVTKVGPGRDPSGEWLPLARPDQLRGQVEENIRQLGRDHLDVVNLRQHGLDSIDEHFGALADLREAGLIRHLGISNIVLPHIAQALAIAPVVCVQNRYGLGARSPSQEAILARCAREGIAFVPFFTIAATGGDAGRNEPDEPAVVEVARAHGVSPAQVRIAWTLHKGAHVLAIPGTGNPDHLEDNIAAGALRLTNDEFAALDAV